MTRHAAPAPGQYDLFGEVEQAEQAALDHEQARVDWRARFEPADWIAPWPTADGHPAGTVYHGWRCPDPECGKVEPTSFALAINHGWDPNLPGQEPIDGRCHRLKLLAAQRAYDTEPGPT